LAAILEDPTSERLSHAEDIYSIGRLMESLNREVLAEQLYASEQINSANNQEFILSLLSRARIHKRNKNYTDALPLWQQAHELGSEEAALALAMYYEHTSKDYQKALEMTEWLMQDSINNPHSTTRQNILSALIHRKERLMLRIRVSSSDSSL